MTDATNPVETSEHAAKVTTYALMYINEVLHYQFVHRKISTLSFQTHHVHISLIHSPSSVQALYSRSCLCCGSLDTGAIVSLTAAKFKPFIFPVLSFALSNITNIFITVVLYYFCLSPT